jgi:hypothetical protein
MARVIALLLVLSTVGVLLADAQCGALCTAKACDPPRTSTGCHHSGRSNHSPGVPQCINQHRLADVWLRAAPRTVVPPQTAVVALVTPEAQVPEPIHDMTFVTAPAAVLPETPPHTILRV